MLKAVQHLHHGTEMERIQTFSPGRLKFGVSELLTLSTGKHDADSFSRVRTSGQERK